MNQNEIIERLRRKFSEKVQLTDPIIYGFEAAWNQPGLFPAVAYVRAVSDAGRLRDLVEAAAKAGRLGDLVRTSAEAGHLGALVAAATGHLSDLVKAAVYAGRLRELVEVASEAGRLDDLEKLVE